MKNNKSGQVLPFVIAILALVILIVGAMVNWLQDDSKLAVKNQNSVTAVNFAEAGIDRGTWKLQSTTSTWNSAVIGSVISGYNFDSTYSDIPGGTYRIKFSTSTNQSVTVLSEGRDNKTKEIRAVSAVFKNQTIYSSLMAGGNVGWSKGLGIYWGPIVSQGDINLDNTTAALYYPRKYARGVVNGTAANPRDTNGLTPPNTDNLEWWTEYSGVPDVPILDFVSLRSSATATGTLNVYGCKNSSPVGAWDSRASCGTNVTAHSQHFGNPWNHPKSAQFNPNTDYVWYWDGDVTLSGKYCGNSACGQSTGLRGTFIIRGNLTIDTPGEYNYAGHVPAAAWKEHQKLTKTTFDTSASGEYPADTGLHQNASTFNFGTDTWCQPGLGCGWRTTVGLKGFVYVGGNLNIINFLDFNGAVWVNGTVTAAGGSNQHFCGIFYDDTLIVPTLNVILNRTSWQEVAPSNVAWP